MPCYTPLDAYYAPGGTISFNRQESFGIPIDLPCGRCIGCRLEHAKEWALRCWHEHLMYEEEGLPSMFITLTYDQEHLPPDGGLDHRHFQKFIRAMRKKTGLKLRYFMCGEYGGQTLRPHYHAIIFGYRPPDLKLVNTRNNTRNYTSEIMSELWPHGGHEIGYVSFKNAGYVARYVLKKQIKPELFDPSTGEISEANLKSPYTRMSLKPGIGYSWYQKYKTDLYPHDYAVLPDGRETAVPKYYRKLLERDDPDLASELRAKRVEKARSNPDNTPSRLEVRHFIQNKKAERLKREL